MQAVGYLTGNFPEFLENIRESNSASALAKTQESFRGVEWCFIALKWNTSIAGVSVISLIQLEVTEQAKEKTFLLRQF